MMPRTYDDPWNKERTVGPRKEFTQTQVKELDTYLGSKSSGHDLCLFMVGIDTMLRAANLVEVRVRDVTLPDGTVRQTFPWKQNKSSKPVYPVLTPDTQKAIGNWIDESGKSYGDYLFTRNKPSDGPPITDGYYRELIKEWVEAIGLFPNDYSGHSLRRTKAVFMYEGGVKIAVIGRLLGHKSEAATIHYLGIDDAVATEAALTHDIFQVKHNKPKQTKFIISPLEMEMLSEDITNRLESKIVKTIIETLRD